jgi:hypothetical protein
VRDLTDADRQSFTHTAAQYVQRATRHRTATWANG